MARVFKLYRIEGEPWPKTYGMPVLPILDYLAGLSSPVLRSVSIGEMPQATGLEPLDIADEVECLATDGFLRGKLQRTLSGGDPKPSFLTSAGLTAKGARAVGMCPNSDPYQALLKAIES